MEWEVIGPRKKFAIFPLLKSHTVKLMSKYVYTNRLEVTQPCPEKLHFVVGTRQCKDVQLMIVRRIRAFRLRPNKYGTSVLTF